MDNQILFNISEATQIGEARRAVVKLVRELGFDENETEKASLIVTELASNLVKHTNGGKLLFQSVRDKGVEILALDKGPGITNVSECLRDGYSTAGSPGTGLGAVKRLSSEFEIYSRADFGTSLFSRLWLNESNNGIAASKYEVGSVCLPLQSEIVCGDNWALKKLSTGCQLLVADGLGHGFEASLAANEAVRIFINQTRTSITEMLESIHSALRSTRGAAVAIADIEFGNIVRYTGIGNIAGAIISDKGQRHMVSHNGIAGHEARKIQEFTYPFEKDALLILHSDGLQTRWSMSSYPGLAMRHPGLIAGTLYRDFARGTDDVTVVAIKES